MLQADQEVPRPPRGDLVEDLPRLTVGDEQPGLAQLTELLRQVGLFQPKLSLYLPHQALAIQQVKSDA